MTTFLQVGVIRVAKKVDQWEQAVSLEVLELCVDKVCKWLHPISNECELSYFFSDAKTFTRPSFTRLLGNLAQLEAGKIIQV
ncbi:hypothetical protein AC249_AIPGENE300 [Exaiptasia diaphana]|nr:hypothetical protein AC249_AIPGENE300 [Exaiptasia diaphana]